MSFYKFIEVSRVFIRLLVRHRFLVIAGFRIYPDMANGGGSAKTPLSSKKLAKTPLSGEAEPPSQRRAKRAGNFLGFFLVIFWEKI